jgi:hypothetical protein
MRVRVDHGDARRAHRLVQQLDEGDVACQRLERIGLVLARQTSAATLEPAAEQLLDPEHNPLLTIFGRLRRRVVPFIAQEERQLAEAVDQREALLIAHVLRTRPGIGPVGATLDQLGVEREHDVIGRVDLFAGLRLGDVRGGRPLLRDPHPAPIDRAARRALQDRIAVGVGLVLDREERHRHPLPEERLERPLLVDLVVDVAGLDRKRRLAFRIGLVPARPAFDLSSDELKS